MYVYEINKLYLERLDKKTNVGRHARIIVVSLHHVVASRAEGG
jgi:hypothetical protein